MYSIRPSKKYLYHVLKKQLKNKKYKIGFDVASEEFKNLPFFKYCHYVGVDIIQDKVKKGMRNFSKESPTGIIYDISCKDNPIGTNVADVVVSTNTLWHIKEEKPKKIALDFIIQLTKKSGDTIIEIDLDDICIKYAVEQFKNNFKRTKKLYYQNFLSYFYEGFFKKDLANNKIAIFFDKIKITHIFALIEYFLSKFPFLNNKMILIGTDCLNEREKFINFNKHNLNNFLNKND